MLSHRLVAVPPVLVPAVGTRHVTLDRVFDVAMSSPEGTMRAQASQVVLSALERDRKLRRRCAAALGRMDRSALVEELNTSSGRHSVELLRYFAAHARKMRLRREATLAIARLTAPGREKKGRRG